MQPGDHPKPKGHQDHRDRQSQSSQQDHHGHQDHRDRHSQSGHQDHHGHQDHRDRHSHQSIHDHHGHHSHHSLHSPRSHHDRHDSQDYQSHASGDHPTMTQKQAREAKINCLSMMGVPFFGGLVLIIFGSLSIAHQLGRDRPDEIGIPLIFCGCFSIVGAVVAFVLIYLDICKVPSKGTRIENGTSPSGSELPPPESGYPQHGSGNTPIIVTVTPASESANQATALSSSGSIHSVSETPSHPSLYNPHAQPVQHSSARSGGEVVQDSMSKPLISDKPTNPSK